MMGPLVKRWVAAAGVLAVATGLNITTSEPIQNWSPAWWISVVILIAFGGRLQIWFDSMEPISHEASLIGNINNGKLIRAIRRLGSPFAVLIGVVVVALLVGAFFIVTAISDPVNKAIPCASIPGVEFRLPREGMTGHGPELKGHVRYCGNGRVGVAVDEANFCYALDVKGADSGGVVHHPSRTISKPTCGTEGYSWADLVQGNDNILKVDITVRDSRDGTIKGKFSCPRPSVTLDDLRVVVADRIQDPNPRECKEVG